MKPLNAFRTLAIFACAGIAIFSIYGLIGGLDGTSRKTVSVSEAAVQGEPATRVSEGPVQAGPSAEASVPAVAPRVALGPLVDALRAMPSVKVVQQPPVAPETEAQPAPRDRSLSIEAEIAKSPPVRLRQPAVTPVSDDFSSFENEASKLTQALDCPDPRVTPAEPDFGALYGCIMGPAETAKVWINENPDVPGVVENVKVMWNDWIHRNLLLSQDLPSVPKNSSTISLLSSGAYRLATASTIISACCLSA